MDTSDGNDSSFDSSADLFDDRGAVMADHNGDKTKTSQPSFTVDNSGTSSTMVYDKRQHLHQSMSNNTESSTGTKVQAPISLTDAPITQYGRLVPLNRDAEVGSSKCCNSSTCHEASNADEVFEEEDFEDLPNKRHKHCESDIDVDMDDCVHVGVLNASIQSLDKVDSSSLLCRPTSPLNGNAVIVRNNLCKNEDSDLEKQMATTNSVVMNGQNHLSFHKELIASGFAKDFDEQRVAGASTNTQATNILQNTSPLLNNAPGMICPFCNLQLDNLYLMEIHIDAMHSEFSNGDGAEAAILNQDADVFVSNGDIFQFVCPLCDFDLGDRVTLDLHLLTIHEEGQNEQALKQETCPLCGLTSDTEEGMKLHIATHGTDQTVYGISEIGQAILSNTTTPSVMTCPVCGLEMTDADLLYSHVESHFNSRHKPGIDLAQTTSSKKDINKENVLVKNNQVRKEPSESSKEIQTKLSSRQNNVPSTSQERETSSSSKENLSYKHQYEQNLEKAVTRGEMSVTDYYEQKLLMAETDMMGVDNGSTRTEGLVEKLELLYRSQAWPGQAVYLCSPTDHYSGSYGDKGWGCGYRNFQMLLSCLSRHQGYAERIFAGRNPLIPSIPKIQQMIELAWKKGFDPQGCRQLRGQLVNTSKWIGATEILATLSSLGIKCHLADFHAPSAPDGTHPRLLEWVSDYFCTRRPGFLPPLYLQHQGHSRTIIGVEKERGTIKLLLFDPGTPRDLMAAIARDQITWKHMRTFRRTQAGLRAKQYQILAVTGFLTDIEYEDSKTLKSEQVS